MKRRQLQAACGALVRFRDCIGFTRVGELRKVEVKPGRTLCTILESSGEYHWKESRDVLGVGRGPAESAEYDRIAPSWRPEVFADGTWTPNGLRFATESEAKEWARDLMMRWTHPSDFRAVPSEDDPNYRRDPDTGETVSLES